MKPPRSLKARALQLLAQREQSRVELRRKLLAHAKAEDAKSGAPTEQPDALGRVDAVLEWLESHQFSSDERFAESRINARASRYGNLRIRQELKQHAVSLPPESAQSLRDSELARAVGVWERRFTDAPNTLADRVKQGRFLASRGFSPEVIRRVLRGERVAPQGRAQPSEVMQVPDLGCDKRVAAERSGTESERFCARARKGAIR